jgi:hypothetical protein
MPSECLGVRAWHQLSQWSMVRMAVHLISRCWYDRPMPSCFRLPGVIYRITWTHDPAWMLRKSNDTTWSDALHASDCIAFALEVAEHLLPEQCRLSYWYHRNHGMLACQDPTARILSFFDANRSADHDNQGIIRLHRVRP